MVSSGASDMLLATVRRRSWFATLTRRISAVLERLLVPAGAIAVSIGIFGVFITLVGADPFSVLSSIYDGAFGSWFSWQNTLERGAPLLLTALCTALPARLGLIIIGGEGGYVIGAIAAVVTAVGAGGASRPLIVISMIVSAMLAAGLWVAAAGALREYRGVNETISSLLLNYIAIAIMNFLVSGPIRDAAVVHRPSSWSIGEQNMLGMLPGMDVHWGLGFGLLACLLTYVLMQHTRFGFAGRIVGGNERAARIVGLPVRVLTVTACFVGGAAAGLAGMAEVASGEGRVNSSIVAGYGYTGILVAFIARHNPLAVIPVAVLLGGMRASGGLLQRRYDLPDATVLVLQGIMFIVILVSEPLHQQLSLRRGRSA